MAKRPIRKMQEPARQEGGGNVLLDILLFPVIGMPKMVSWFGKKLGETAEQEELDEGKLQGQLLELQMRYELGEINDEEYSEEETEILDRLSAIRKVKEEG